jgi:hypothetical protein
MSTASAAAQDVKQHLQRAEADARDAVRKVSPWIERFARFGLVAKGFVYLVIGWLALRVALIGGGKLVDQRGAMRDVLHHTFGTVLLAILAVGLFGFMTWMLARALLNPEHLPHKAKTYFKRIGWLFTAVVYGGLGVAAVRLLLGMRHEQSHLMKDWTRTLIGQPFGKWLVIAVGVGFIAYGVWRVYMARRCASTDKLLLDHVAERARGVIVALVWLGEIARAIVFTIIGVFAISAARHANPDEAKGLAEALAYIAAKPYGPWMLGAVAAGLMAYGLYQLVEARYRRIHFG